MRKLNPSYVEAVTERVNSCPYFKLLSMKIRSLALGESQLEVDVQDKHFQPYEMVHGGVCASLIDAAAFWAAFSQMDREAGLTTVEMKLNYLTPVSEGRLIARGRCIKEGKAICLADATIENEEGTLVAHGTSTMMVLESLRFQGESGFPPKFKE